MQILTIDEVKKELRVDDDFDDEIIIGYIADATAYINTVTGYDWTKESEVDPLCKRCAKLYIKQEHFETEYKKDYDYTLGISSLIYLLNCKVGEKNASKI